MLYIMQIVAFNFNEILKFINGDLIETKSLNVTFTYFRYFRVEFADILSLFKFMSSYLILIWCLRLVKETKN